MAATVDTWERLLSYTWDECASRTWDNVAGLPYGVRQAFKSAHNASIVQSAAYDSANNAASDAATGIQQYSDSIKALQQAVGKLGDSLDAAVQTCG